MHAGAKNWSVVLRVVQTNGCSECWTKPVSLPAKITDNCTSRGITSQLGSKQNVSNAEKDRPLVKVTWCCWLWIAVSFAVLIVWSYWLNTSVQWCKMTLMELKYLCFVFCTFSNIFCISKLKYFYIFCVIAISDIILELGLLIRCEDEKWTRFDWLKFVWKCTIYWKCFTLSSLIRFSMKQYQQFTFFLLLYFLILIFMVCVYCCRLQLRSILYYNTYIYLNQAPWEWTNR